MNDEKRKPADWENVCDQLGGITQNMWHERAVELARFIGDSDKIVIDLGAGDMFLKTLLADDIQYYPIDYVKRCDDTILCDFNKREFPEISGDVAVCAGILEYMKEPDWFIDKATKIAPKVLISYKGREKFADSQLYTSEIIEKFLECGYILKYNSNLYTDKWTLLACFEKKNVLLKENALLIEENRNCTGCGACKNICPQNAIEMIFDQNGYLHPYLNKKCNSCGRCTLVCPTINNESNNFRNPECYAVWACDEGRMKSSSGGFFPTAAKYVLDRNGIVYGAAWSENFYCEHIGIESEELLDKICHSKYVQSNTKNTFEEVRRWLEQDRDVLYVGCPCQIAGLLKFLQSAANNEHLLVIDLICFCAPSICNFRKYLDENYGIENISDVIFRDKKNGWSPRGYRIDLMSGESVFPAGDIDSYQVAFHSVLARNDVCENCQFSDFPRQGDITIGDFWGINQHDASWDDTKGTSLVLVNNNRGRQFFESLIDAFQRVESVPLEWALDKGNRIAYDGRPHHKNRDLFTKLLRNYTFNDSVRIALEGWHDIGLVCLSNHNIGNNLTNYALYQYLCDCGYTVQMIPQPIETGYCISKEGEQLSLYLNNPYSECDFDLSNMDIIKRANSNSTCRMYLLGSDQCLRAPFVEGMRDHSLLKWASDRQYKAVYSGSFGLDYFEGSQELINRMKVLLKRFDRISVRESSGVELMKKTFGIDATFVLDPVFLCNKSHYENMISLIDSDNVEEAYVGCYILDPTIERGNLIRQIAHTCCIEKVLAVLDSDGFPDGRYEWDIDTIHNVHNEEWLANIKNCDFFITDSFHGLCFALIFHKQFCVVYNDWQWRGETRIKSLLTALKLEERMIASYDDFRQQGLSENKIDYKMVDSLLNDFILKSKAWLVETIELGLKHDTRRMEKSAYDYLLDEEISCEQFLREQLGNLNRLTMQCEEIKIELEREQNINQKCKLDYNLLLEETKKQNAQMKMEYDSNLKNIEIDFSNELQSRIESIKSIHEEELKKIKMKYEYEEEKIISQYEKSYAYKVGKMIMYIPTKMHELMDKMMTRRG